MVYDIYNYLLHFKRENKVTCKRIQYLVLKNSSTFAYIPVHVSFLGPPITNLTLLLCLYFYMHISITFLHQWLELFNTCHKLFHLLTVKLYVIK